MAAACQGTEGTKGLHYTCPCSCWGSAHPQRHPLLFLAGLPAGTWLPHRARGCPHHGPTWGWGCALLARALSAGTPRLLLSSLLSLLPHTRRLEMLHVSSRPTRQVSWSSEMSMQFTDVSFFCCSLNKINNEIKKSWLF